VRDIFRTRKARLAPVLITAIFALASLKAAGLWINFSSAGAEETQTAPPTLLTPTTKPQSETKSRLLEQLAARTKDLDTREAQLDTRESVIAAAELRVEAAMQALQQEKESLALTEGDRARERRDEIGALSNAYERMKPRDAARIFEVLDDDILIPVAAGMRTQSLAGVLAEMTAERAKFLTIALANREAPTTVAVAPAPALDPVPAAASVVEP
jgi:flagellar motility protein MotE (MotC chaperone)